MLGPRYNKDLTGAEILFQPDALHLYKDDPFDVQITVGRAPLEDGYYFTLQDPALKNMSIGELLLSYALNRNKRFELDIDKYPEFPNYMEELAQYIEAAEKGNIALDIYVNKCPENSPVDLNATVSDYLSTCTFKNQSHDYCLLDLVFEVTPPQASQEELEVLINEHGPVWTLFWLFELERAKALDDTTVPLMVSHDCMYPRLQGLLMRLEESGLVEVSGSHTSPVAKLTPSGKNQVVTIHEEIKMLMHKYAPFESVSVYPPALGVPDGFDARIQVMRSDSIDVTRAVFLLYLYAFKKRVFLGSEAALSFETGDCFRDICSTFLYETTFSQSILQELISVASHDADAPS